MHSSIVTQTEPYNVRSSFHTDQTMPPIFTRRLFLRSFAVLVILGILGTASLAVYSMIIWPDLPPLDSIIKYEPKVPTKVYTADNHLIKEIGDERRSLVDIKDVPDSLKNALIAAEDQNFYTHHGIDPVGVLRAIASIRPGKRAQGASTITQQVARNMFLTTDRTAKRKISEILLSLKMEQNLSKDKILEVYINQIFLGHRSHGFDMAAKTYFGKSIKDVSLAEATMLATIPKAPSNINPIDNIDRLKIRQKYVLARMLEDGSIDQVAHDKALAEDVKITAGDKADDTITVHADYVAEMAKDFLIEKFGKDAVQRGYTITTTLYKADQEAAYKALRKGVRDFDLRHGYRGPEKVLSLGDKTDSDTIDDDLEEIRGGSDARMTTDYGDMLVAVVLKASVNEVVVYRKGKNITIKGAGLNFVNRAKKDLRPTRGAIVRIRETGKNTYEITQMPDVEAALVSIDSKDGAVRALVGGFDFGYRQFNNVLLAQRQPGSSFKPFIYSLGLENELWPGSLILDTEMTVDNYTPRNYDRTFSGPISVRTALAKSKNVPAVRILEAVKPQNAQTWVGNFGFKPANHPPVYSMALGSGKATPGEMVRAYAVFANTGYLVEIHWVKEIKDASGKVVYQANPSSKRVIEERNAWIMDSMLRTVVDAGTAGRARALGRTDLAGKTGTTNDYFDAWFAGYNPDMVAVAWVGYPTPKKMGSGETGGVAALPIWIDYMRTALASKPNQTIPMPEGITSGPSFDNSGQDFYYAETANPPIVEEEQGLIDSLGNDNPDWINGTPATEHSAAAPANLLPDENGDVPILSTTKALGGAQIDDGGGY